jgi:hypothetical protein
VCAPGGGHHQHDHSKAGFAAGLSIISIFIITGLVLMAVRLVRAYRRRGEMHWFWTEKGYKSDHEKALLEDEEEPDRVVLNAMVLEDEDVTEVVGLDGTVVASFSPLVPLTAANAAQICDGVREQSGLRHFVVLDSDSGLELAAEPPRLRR